MNEANALAVRQEFNGTNTTLATVETASSAAASKAKALVEARYIMAKRFPRDMDGFREKMLKECRRPSFAAVARYEKPIGKDKTKWPRGPSIRYAEAAVRLMTNIGVETTVVYDDRQKRIVHVSVTDYESSVPYEEDVVIQKTVERRSTQEGDEIIGTRKNSYGDNLFILVATDDEIINKQRAEISKVIRTQGLRLVPGDIIDECMQIVVETLQRQDAQDPDAAKRKLFDAFAEIGVNSAQIKEYLGNDAATITPKELTELRGIYSAIRDGESTWRDAMENRGGPESEKKTSASRTEIPSCTDEEFKTKTPRWRKQLFEDGVSEADLIKMIETRTKLSDDQKTTINSWTHEQD